MCKTRKLKQLKIPSSFKALRSCLILRLRDFCLPGSAGASQIPLFSLPLTPPPSSLPQSKMNLQKFLSSSLLGEEEQIYGF